MQLTEKQEAASSRMGIGIRRRESPSQSTADHSCRSLGPANFTSVHNSAQVVWQQIKNIPKGPLKVRYLIYLSTILLLVLYTKVLSSY